jgi:hypothetical protein
MKLLISFVLTLFLVNVSGASAQFVCNTWNDSPKKNQGEEAHSIYRQALNGPSKDYELAKEYWQIAYDIAPAADGKRDFHLTDGIKIYKHYLKETDDEAKKAEYKAKIIELYEQCVQCYEQRAIEMNDCDDDCYEQKIGFVLGRMGYDMFYELNAGYDKNYEVLKRAIEINDVGSEYIVLEPIAHIAVYQYQKDKETAETMRQLYSDIERIGDYNIENDPDYSEYFDSSKKRAMSKFKEIEDDIFDCDYFKKKWLPVYEADPTNFEIMKQVVVTLKRRGCDSSDPDVAKIEEEYEKLAATHNAGIQAEYERNNPNVMAKKLYDSGDYAGAKAKYEEAIAKESDPMKKAGYLFSKAAIEGRKLNSLSAARSSLKEAMQLRPDWGRPYMLLGDLYAIQSRNCGDGWDRGLGVLAAIEQYARARSIDPEVASEASSRIAKYQGSKPDSEEAFMKGNKAGQSVSVGCGIGETVRLSFR